MAESGRDDFRDDDGVAGRREGAVEGRVGFCWRLVGDPSLLLGVLLCGVLLSVSLFLDLGVRLRLRRFGRHEPACLESMHLATEELLVGNFGNQFFLFTKKHSTLWQTMPYPITSHHRHLC